MPLRGLFGKALVGNCRAPAVNYPFIYLCLSDLNVSRGILKCETKSESIDSALFVHRRYCAHDARSAVVENATERLSPLCREAGLSVYRCFQSVCAQGVGIRRTIAAVYRKSAKREV